MKQKVEDFIKSRPQMAEKYDFPGTFRDFAVDIASNITPHKERNIMRDVVLDKVDRILREKISRERLEKQLSDYHIISYADHHGLLNYKLLYNSNLLYAEVVKSLKLPYAVVFATGNIPLKNTSYPRGFYFKGRKFNFFKNKQRHIPVNLLDDKIDADREKGAENFILNYNKEDLTREEKKFLEFLFFDCLEIENASRDYNTFSDQITFLNYKLWKYYFEESIRDSIPDMIYLQSNQVVLSLLINDIKKEDSLVSMILFEPKIRNVFIKQFQGIQGCWSENMGSIFFWGISDKKKFIPLQLDASSNSLTGQDIRVELERDAIINALQAKKITPTLFFDFLLITFLEGNLALGGFNQIEFLTQMKHAHVRSLKELGMNDLAERFASRATEGLVCGIFPSHYDSGIDLIWELNSKDGKFNGNLYKGLTQTELNDILDMKVKYMILTAIETMLENVTA